MYLKVVLKRLLSLSSSKRIFAKFLIRDMKIEEKKEINVKKKKDTQYDY